MTVLAGDIGGTNSRFAIYDPPPSGLRGVKPIFEQTYPSAAHASLDIIAERFLVAATAAVGPRAIAASACFGIAGPIENNICRATNLPWVVDGHALSQRLGIARVLLVNDFHAAALGVTAVGSDELVALGGDVRIAHGPMAVLGAPGQDPAAAISQRAMAGTDPVCEMALALFCSVLGAVAGNLGLMVLATGGVFVAGGIAPRVLPYLQRGGFREAFDRKGRLHTLVERMPAYVVTHPQPGLLGAATIAAGQA